ncbi:unnamed protein product [Rotaria sordida]|uniref:Protein kinase domain-containing protein n=1 Tax=Rotaria sordida TaxID=392033 RepID=A0A813MYI7_9BILA|nr:unnamed protein product [Rotaria sordida]CAF0943003.1 unnamed protein product [Rotaria sordida]
MNIHTLNRKQQHVTELKVINSDSLNPNIPLPYKYYGQKLWETIQTIVYDLNYSCETVELHKLDFQEHESVNKFLNADIVVMDVTNQDRRPTFMYHKGNRESVDCMNDIVLIQASDVENDRTNAIQDLKTTCKIKQIIEYQYDEKNNVFYDVTTQKTNSSTLLKISLKCLLKEAADNMQEGLATRYLNRLQKRKNEVHDANAECIYLWREICDEILTKTRQQCATPKLITQLMYAFRDIQDYQSMIELIERCEQYEIISKRIQNNTMILYLTAFARSRRNQNDDRDKALEVLKRLCQTKKTENELSNDIICLCGRIYKDKYTESNCQDKNSLEKAIEYYRRGFAADPNIYAGINLLFLLAITTDDLIKNNEAYKIIIILNALLGKKGRSLKDLNDYWDVATYFELHAVLHYWSKACQAALHMYLLNPPIWYLKSTINNLKILHQATRLRDQKRLSSREQSKITTADEHRYSFWIDFFSDAINSNSTSSEERELPAQVPILICDNYEKTDGAPVNNIYVEAHLQLNFHTDCEPETLVIRIIEQQEQICKGNLVKTIEMNSIRSIINVKRDNRSIFLYAYENSETFSAVELQIYFASAERRTAFNEKMSKYRVETIVEEAKFEFDLEFDRDQNGQRIALGQGTYGKVYRAQDRITWKKFAVKEIPMRNPSYTEVLENEIKILSTLNHKNIVSYYGTAVDSNKKPPIFQVIMEYVDGGSLSQLLANFGKFPEQSIRKYTRQLLEGLQYLHENHILHRDIKSANILINSRGEIKIADFGTSKRLAGLHLCTDDIVGTLQYMSPDVVFVPPMGYGPEVDIWSVGCTVIEMATGKRPFHNVTNNFALLFKIGNEKQSPDIPSELSDIAKDFLAKCFEPPHRRPSAKDLLNHPFCKTKAVLSRELSGNLIIVADPSPLLRQSSSDEDSMFSDPARDLATQISIDDRRRLKLANLLRDKDNRTALINQWLSLIEEKRETDLLDIKKLLILFDGICDYLDHGNVYALGNTLDQICDRTTMDSDLRIDLERSFYFFIKAANNVLSRHRLPPHDLFALDNIMRRIAEDLVGLIRSDFIPAVNNMTPLTPNNDLLINALHARTLSTNSLDGKTIDEVTRLHEQYRKLTEKNREQLRQLIKIESNNEIKLIELVNNERNCTSSETTKIFLPIETPTTTETTNSPNSPVAISTEQTNGIHTTSTSRGIKRSRALADLEQEHERLLKDITDNRTRVNEILHA